MKSELSEKFDQLLKELVEQAFSDDMVSDEEYELINQIEVGVEELTKTIFAAYVDGIITEEESEQMIALKQKILDQAENIANKDGIISKDENELLSKLSTLISKYFDKYFIPSP
ncbi:MAG: hypothetical protein HeimC2_18410 [Candidatus Heimdallarchaeota archaeon LC_2]|nr:MAG: hypothetical protein HeimC2_18410 [Candidatus Heimdallarchaeota archaeon LC_2]